MVKVVDRKQGLDFKGAGGTGSVVKRGEWKGRVHRWLCQIKIKAIGRQKGKSSSKNSRIG